MRGAHIFVRPHGIHQLTLIDDLTSAAIIEMKRCGFEPALIIETSHANFQAWLNHECVLTEEMSTQAAKELARRVEGDPSSADWRHLGLHQLKNNPSEALRKLKDAPVLVLKGDKPTAIMLNLDGEALLNEPDVKLAIATELFRCGHLSLGRAARLAGMPIVEFMRHLSARGVPIIKGTAKDAQKDLETLNKWRASS